MQPIQKQWNDPGVSLQSKKREQYASGVGLFEEETDFPSEADKW